MKTPSTDVALDEKGMIEPFDVARPSDESCSRSLQTVPDSELKPVREASAGSRTQALLRSSTDTQSSTNSKSSPRNSKYHVLGLLGVFIVALAARLWFNFATTHVNCANACDASEYLRNASALMGLQKLPISFWQDALSVLLGNSAQEVAVRAQLSTLAEMHQSAPIYPLFLLSSFAIAGVPFDAVDCVAPVAAQSLLSALTCVLIAMIGARAWSRPAGLAAGIFAAFYPGFIVNSGRLYTETFSAFLICALFWLVALAFSAGNGAVPDRGAVRDNDSSIKERSAPALPILFVAGITAAALQLTRSIMLSACLALVPLTYWVFRKHRPLAKVAALVAGFALVVVPWFALQKLTFGKVNLVVDRAGHYNFFIGNDVETDGLLSYPYANCSNVESRSYPSIISESFAKNPPGWMTLTMDKMIRLLKLPCNDFRTPIGPFTHAEQSFVHQFMLVLAALGLVLGLTTNVGASAPDRKQLACRIAITATLMLHLIYVLFITVPRYNLTAMPFVLLFSGAGVVSLLALSKHLSSRPPAFAAASSAALLFVCARMDLVAILSAVPIPADAYTLLVVACGIKMLISAAFLFSLWRLVPSLSGYRWAAKGAMFLLASILLVLVCLPLRAHGRWYEWQCSLGSPGDSVSQSILLPGTLSSRPLYLMIDTEGDLDGVEIVANGRRLSGPAVPSLSLVPEVKPALESGASLRRECEFIFQCMTQGAGISNRELRQWFLIPIDPSILIASEDGSKLDVTITKKSGPVTKLFGAYDRGPGANTVPSTTLYSWEKTFYGVENDGGLTDTRYDTDVKELRYSRANLSLAGGVESGSSPSSGVESRSFPSTFVAPGHDLSPEPGLQTGNYNIRLLVGPHNAQVPSLGNNIASENESTWTPSVDRIFAAEGKPILAASADSISLNKDHANERLSLAVPVYSRSSVWLLKVSGERKGTESDGAVAVNLIAQFDADNKGILSYHSPWTRKLAAKPEWQPFELALPLEPGYFPGKLRKFELRLNQHGSAAVEVKNLTVTVTPLSSNPLLPGHEIY